MEQFLVRTGWSLVAFSPERRRYQDRRGFPRVNPDRRRWWTDGRATDIATEAQRAQRISGRED
jgi:hypothetical protein